jgi:multiple antibiotic resistance protein
MVLFAVIDVVGSVPVIINLRQTTGELQSGKASLVSLAIMVVFLFAGESILQLIGLTVNDFAIAGSLVIFFIALEMILGIRLYKEEVTSTASVVPLAFPLIAGTGTLTTLLSMRFFIDRNCYQCSYCLSGFKKCKTSGTYFRRWRCCYSP